MSSVPRLSEVARASMDFSDAVVEVFVDCVAVKPEPRLQTSCSDFVTVLKRRLANVATGLSPQASVQIPKVLNRERPVSPPKQVNVKCPLATARSKRLLFKDLMTTVCPLQQRVTLIGMDVLRSCSCSAGRNDAESQVRCGSDCLSRLLRLAVSSTLTRIRVRVSLLSNCRLTS